MWSRVDNFLNLALAFILAISIVPLAKADPLQRRFSQELKAELVQLAESSHAPQIEVLGTYPTQAQRRFVETYLREVAPLLAQKNQATQAVKIYQTLLMAGAYTDKDEEVELTRALAKAEKAKVDFAVSDQVTEILKNWAAQSHGLKGELARMARALFKQNELERFPKAAEPLLRDVAERSMRYQQALDQAPSNARLGEYMQSMSRITRGFKTQQIDFQTARAQLRALEQDAIPQRLAQEALSQAGEGLNQAAIERSQLARLKGYRSWAAYKIALEDAGFHPQYRGLDLKFEMLKKLAENLKPIEARLRQERLNELGLKIEAQELRAEDIPLLTRPDVRELNPFFPPDRIRQILLKTAKDSGFGDETLSQIVIDDEMRPNRNETMGIMEDLKVRATSVRQLNVKTLDFLEVPPESGLWQPSLMYTLQSYPAGGIFELETAVHEFGHAVDHVEGRRQGFHTLTYAQQEIASMTMERFLRDPHYLYEMAQNSKGEKPEMKRITELVKNTKAFKILVFQDYVFNSIFDLALWDYDFTKSSARTFLEQAEWAYQTASQWVGRAPSIASENPAFYRLLSTTHFTGGHVFYYGYVFAEIAADMISNFATDELTQKTGRTSWFEQPALAELLIQKVYRQSWRQKFPKNIETITSHKFDAHEWVASIKAQLWRADEKGCEAKLTQP